MSKSLLNRPGCQDTYPTRTQSMRGKTIGPFVNALSWLPSQKNIPSNSMKVLKTLPLLGVLKTRNISNVTYSFNHFLSTLTGLELLVAFSITTSPPGSWKKRPADVLCFRNRDDGVSRVAFRWKDSSGATTGWTTATLTKIVSTHNDKALLEVELAFRQDGQLLGLAGVAAIGGKRNSSTKNLEKWALQLESGSALPLKYNHCKYTFAQSFMPVISTPLTTFSR